MDCIILGDVHQFNGDCLIPLDSMDVLESHLTSKNDFRFTQFKKYNLNRHMQKKHNQYYQLTYQTKRRCLAEVLLKAKLFYNQGTSVRPSVRDRGLLS